MAILLAALTLGACAHNDADVPHSKWPHIVGQPCANPIYYDHDMVNQSYMFHRGNYCGGRIWTPQPYVPKSLIAPVETPAPAPSTPPSPPRAPTKATLRVAAFFICLLQFCHEATTFRHHRDARIHVYSRLRDLRAADRSRLHSYLVSQPPCTHWHRRTLHRSHDRVCVFRQKKVASYFARARRIACSRNSVTEEPTLSSIGGNDAPG